MEGVPQRQGGQEHHRRRVTDSSRSCVSFSSCFVVSIINHPLPPSLFSPRNRRCRAGLGRRREGAKTYIFESVALLQGGDEDEPTPPAGMYSVGDCCLYIFCKLKCGAGVDDDVAVDDGDDDIPGGVLGV